MFFSVGYTREIASADSQRHPHGNFDVFHLPVHQQYGNLVLPVVDQLVLRQLLELRRLPVFTRASLSVIVFPVRHL